MFFFFKFFDKDVEFFKSLSNRKKKLLIYFFCFFFVFFIYYINIIEIKRIYFFCFLLLLLLIWKSIIELCCYFFVDNNKLKLFIRKYDNIFNYILNILLFIQKWKNPLLILLLYIDKSLLKIIRNLIYIFKIKYRKDLTEYWLDKLFFIFYIIINILLGPLKLIFGFFYTALRSIIDISFSLFFIIRIIGFLFSVLVFSDLLNILYNTLGFFNLFLFFYLFFIIISIIVKYIDRDFEFLKIQYINDFINTDYLINLRNCSTLFGFFILTISCYQNTLIEKKYIDVTSSYLKLELEEGFYKYWEYYKRNIWLITIHSWKEIKNRPSFYLYLNLLAWINLSSLKSSYIPNAITNIIYVKYKVNYLKISLLEDIKKDIDFLYEFFLLRLKLLIFMLWDIDNFIGNKNYNYIRNAFDKRTKIYSIIADDILFDYFNKNNFKVEENKEDLIFYDPENNMEFFDRLFILIGIIPFNENPLEIPVYSEPIQKINILAENIELRLIKFDNTIIWSRGWHCNIKKEEEEENLFLEEKVKDWIVQFLKEAREEWEFLLKKEIIEERNWRLLNELENFVITKTK